MPNEIIFNKNANGLGTPLPNNDHISGLLFYTDATLPSGFASNDRVKIVYSKVEAEDLGITDTHLGETDAAGTVTITGAGAQNDTIKVEVVTDYGTIDLGTAAVPSTPTTTTVADAVVAAINAGTLTHGFSASNAAAVITVTAPEGNGVAANGWTFTLTLVGTVTATNAAFANGVASDIDILHYHVSEFFRAQPKGKLYISLQATADVGTWAKVTELQNFANGEIRQLGVYQKGTAWNTNQVTGIQAVLTTLETNKKPLVVLYQAEISGTTNLATLTDTRLLASPQVTVCIGQDGGAIGAGLYRATEKTIGCVGLALGTVALSSVHESIAWVGKFNMATTEMDTLAYGNGDLWTSLSDGLKASLDTYGYLALKKQTDVVGSYFTDSPSSVTVTNDFASIERNRTMYKAIKNVRSLITPLLSSPLYVQANGTMRIDTVNYFKTQAGRGLEQMQRDGEISEFQVVIDPAQNVVSTSNVTLKLEIIPVGVARKITVNIGFTPKLSA